MTHLITCKNLSVGHERIKVAGPFNLEINSGDYLCVIGENGSGKSTFMKTILGLISPIEGTIEHDESFNAREIGYLAQQTQVQKDFPSSVEEVVLSGFVGHLGHRWFYNKKEKELAKEYMAKTGVDRLAKHCYRDLSGGQQQRTLLARALCAADKMILLDEPAAGLDPDAMQYMYDLISKLNKEGMTIVMITHDVPAVVQYANRIVRFVDGKVKEISTDEYRKVVEEC
ncbi:MAG: ATP-binding cassette domain-containing protein [Solobacterium sp.]|jgi:ABC transporter related protein|uniref:metal ABC transporter ATP-binding protein n=1 Tax=uncultured Solobacterium sp. TaxID=747375 RepID=UPI001CB56BBE|nr:ATP-binding cassette domain-containing protein [uncultured Solobacterium sp.]MBF1115127.1 ATP-binding cassette domain-containing protein [Solobacterium sp.]